jgi:hypothetical protein
MYAAFFRSGAGYKAPAKFGFFLAAWAYLGTRFNEAEPGTREIPLEEWVATPSEYLVHPSMHPKLLARVAGESDVPDARAEALKKAGVADFNQIGHGKHHH